MEGLASIALAAAQLEQESQHNGVDAKKESSSSATDEQSPKKEIVTADSACKHPQPPLLPVKHGFGHGPPRLVSSNSIGSTNSASVNSFGDQSASSAPVTPTPPTSTPSTVTADLTSLPRPIGELPKAPPPTEVITTLMEHDVLCGRGGETNHWSGESVVSRQSPGLMAFNRGSRLLAIHHV
jgi:hypothetical protein